MVWSIFIFVRGWRLHATIFIRPCTETSMHTYTPATFRRPTLSAPSWTVTMFSIVSAMRQKSLAASGVKTNPARRNLLKTLLASMMTQHLSKHLFFLFIVFCFTFPPSYFVASSIQQPNSAYFIRTSSLSIPLLQYTHDIVHACMYMDVFVVAQCKYRNCKDSADDWMGETASLERAVASLPPLRFKLVHATRWRQAITNVMQVHIHVSEHANFSFVPIVQQWQFMLFDFSLVLNCRCGWKWTTDDRWELGNARKFSPRSNFGFLFSPHWLIYLH